MSSASPDRPASSGTWIAALLGTHRRRRIRLTQWLISVYVYFASAIILWFGLRPGETNQIFFMGWCVFLAIGLSGTYVALRTGWSEQFADPALTEAQIVLAVICVEWGYFICGLVRGDALLPLLLIFTFGAFSLSWRKIMWLTLFALASLIATVLALNASRSGVNSWSLENGDLRLDLTNVLMIMVLLPALSLVAARLSSLRYRLRSQRAALTAALEEVRRLATHDELTGLVNRRCMQERLTLEQQRVRREGNPFSIAIIDLDHFKQINDELGHAFGDRVLQAFANEARATLRATDLIARWGGEEFLVLLPATPIPQAEAGIARLLERMPGLPHGADRLLTFSAGLTAYRRDENVADTIARADGLMYEAKESGRNRVCLDSRQARTASATRQNFSGMLESEHPPITDRCNRSSP